MKPILVVVGVIVLLLGGIWALQGSGILLGSFMSNDATWLGIGAVTVVVGAALLVLGARLPGRAEETKPS